MTPDSNDLPASSNETDPQNHDIWSDWISRKRHGDDDDYAREISQTVSRIRDRVLDGAGLAPGMTFADIGTGDGLIAMGAFTRFGPTLNAVLTDVSAPLLEKAEENARAAGVADHCRFLKNSADRLDAVKDESVDVVTTRAVLAYVADKKAAFNECHRVLKPGGRLSFAEPVFRDIAIDVASLGAVLEKQEPSPDNEILRLFFKWKSAQFPATFEAIRDTPITSFTERDLIGFAQGAGFQNIHLELHIDVRSQPKLPWDTLLDIAPHPQAPTLRKILDTRFTDNERKRFLQQVRPSIESGKTQERNAIAYLTAVKPAKSI